MHRRDEVLPAELERFAAKSNISEEHIKLIELFSLLHAKHEEPEKAVEEIERNMVDLQNPLKGYLERRLRIIRHGEDELELMEIFASFEREAHKQLKMSQAEALLLKLDEFVRTNASKKFVIEQRSRIEALQARLKESAYVVKDGLLCYLNFEEAEGDKVRCLVTGKQGTLIGGARLVDSGISGKTLAVEQLGAGLRMEDNKLTLLDKFTICVWVKIEDLLSHPRTIVFKGGNYQLRIADQWQAGLRFDHVGEKGIWGGKTERGQWQHLAVTFDGTTLNMQVFIQGKLAGAELVNPTKRRPQPNNEPLIVGNSTKGGLVTLIDEVRIYNKVLSSQAIETLAKRTNEER